MGWRIPGLEHPAVGIAKVLFPLFECGALAEHTRDVPQAGNPPVAAARVFQ
jgi:hypothetical protein